MSKKEDVKEELLRAIHEGLGGDGWGNSTRSYDEMTYSRERLKGALKNVLKAISKLQKKS